MSMPMPPGPPPIQQPAKRSIWNKKLGGADGLFGWNRLAFANSATRREAKALLFQELAEAVRHDMPLDEALSLAMRSDGETGPKPIKPEGDALSSVTMMLYVLFLSVGGIILLMLISAWASDVERVARVLAHRLLPLIRQLVDERPSYGYRRITALLNWRLQGQDLPRVNAKRVLRILQKHGFVLQRHTGRQLGRTHDGVVVALASDIRWCSDHFELNCRNGEIMRVLFAIDACDREIIAWSATTTGISGEMVQDLMIACVEKRFGNLKTLHPVEWLSDNGSAYIAKGTRHTAIALGLRLCFTPVRSPQSNGIAEAFVKTFRRDYLRLSILPDAATVLGLLQAWMDDYNTVHPHSALRFQSPAEFRRISA